MIMEKNKKPPNLMLNRRQRLERTGVALLHYEKMFGSVLLTVGKRNSKF